jgi:hypothetical protein
MAHPYRNTTVPIDPRRVLGLRDFPSSLEILAAFEWLASRESPEKGGYTFRIARLASARDALLNLDDGL